MFRRRLGALERALLISDEYAPFNVVAVVQLETPPVPETMAAALAAAQQGHASLQTRIEKDARGRPSFVQIENPALPFTQAPRAGEEAWRAVVESELSRRIEARAGPLYRSTYLYEPERAELVLTFQHTAVDAPSVVAFAHDLLARCAGREPAAGTPAGLPPAAEMRFPPGFRGLRLAPRLLAYALAQMGDELGYRMQTRGMHEPGIPFGAAPRILTMETEPATTAVLVRRARKEQVTLNSLLNAAMVLAVHRRRYGTRPRPMRTFTFPDLRPFISPQIAPDALAAYFSMLRYTLRLDGNPSVWAVARDLHRQIYGSLKRGDKYAAHLMSEGLMRMMTRLKSMRMTVTALSYTGLPALEPAYASTRVCGLHGFISNIDLGPEYSAQVSLFGERLVWDIVYLDKEMDRAEAQSIADEIQAVLREAAEGA